MENEIEYATPVTFAHKRTVTETRVMLTARAIEVLTEHGVPLPAGTMMSQTTFSAPTDDDVVAYFAALPPERAARLVERLTESKRTPEKVKPMSLNDALKIMTAELRKLGLVLP